MRGASALLAMAVLAFPADATGFAGLFAFPNHDGGGFEARPTAPPFAPQADQAVCIAAIRQAERTHAIPPDLLLAIGLQEAGMSYNGSMTIWPWSLNVEGRGVRFDSRAEAEIYLAGQLAQGKRSIDVGCLQINLRWHPDAFPTPADGFDPVRNADYAARFLRGLYAETGDWMQAAGHYHSAAPQYKDIYLAGIERHLKQIARAGGAFDDLAAQVVLPAVAGAAPLIAAETWVNGRRMNPLRAPVRLPPGMARVLPATFHRTLDLPAPDAPTLPEDPQSPPLPDPVRVAERRMFGGIALLPAPPLTAAPDEMMP